ncbi:MAG TPA: DUF885 domain-containing protein [Thermoplasmata archaeon]|nr:DUF885 domain-containing protein [Thermoplasmata archaeon]
MCATESSTAKAFRSYLEDDWKKWLAEYPELATSFGFPGLDDRWTDDSTSGIERRRRHLAESIASLKQIDRADLSGRERTNYELYRDLLDVAERGLSFGLDPLPFNLGMPHSLRVPINQMEGIHLTASDTLDLQPRTRISDYDSILSRLKTLGAAVDQNRALLEVGLREGYTPCRVAVRGVPDQIRGLVPSEPLESPLLRPFREWPERIGEEDRRRFTTAAREAYRDSIAPAFRRLLDYLVSTYLPACREVPGVSALPDGAALYEHLVRYQTTTPMTPREIHEVGLAEVRRIGAEMKALMKKTGFSGTFPEFLEFLRTDDQFFLPSAEALVDAYRVIAKKTDPGLARVFGCLPRLPYGVLPVPDFRAKSSPAAYYMPGAPATGRAGTFYANTYDLRARPRWEMEALCLHEAVPGHHLQIALAQEVGDLPDFRRFTGPTAFVEGWGLYAESLGEELGHYRDPYSKVGQHTFDMWRSIRLVVDTGMHALGWTREDAIRFFRENTGKSDVDIAVEVDRYIVWPGQALAYKIGQLKIRELRTFAEHALADRFDPRTFHDRVLEEGAIPLGMLDRRVRDWVDSQTSSGRREPPGPGPTPR